MTESMIAGRTCTNPWRLNRLCFAAMKAHDVLSHLGLDEAADTLTPYWDESQRTYPNTSVGAPAAEIRFLQPAAILSTRAFAGLPEASDATLLRAAAQIRGSAQLCALAWHCNHLAFQQFEFPAAQIRHWPDPIPALGELSGAFYLLIALDAVPRMLDAHRLREIPESVSRACFSHFPISLQMYRDQNEDHIGVQTRALYWLRNHVRGDLFRLGRLEYMVKPFGGHLVAWRHRLTRAVVAIAADRVPYDDEGIVVADTESASWRAALTETAESVTGTPISPLGYALREPITLSRSEWEPVLTAGDPILEVHIPPGGDMTPPNCLASMRQALEFFPRYFSDRPFVGFACGSWILNPELAQIYRPDSNIVLWQRELYLFPTPNRRDSRSGLYFVFGTDSVDLATAPRDTSMRRALLDHLATDGRLLGGGMFLLLEDFDHYGTQVYRSATPQ